MSQWRKSCNCTVSMYFLFLRLCCLWKQTSKLDIVSQSDRSGKRVFKCIYFFTSLDPPFVRIVIRTQVVGRYKWGTGGHLVTDRNETFLIFLVFHFCTVCIKVSLHYQILIEVENIFSRKLGILSPDTCFFHWKTQKTNKQKQFSSKKKSILEILQETKTNM